MARQLLSVTDGVAQLYPSLSVAECQAWFEYVSTRPDYYISIIGKAVCITKVYDQVDPPWLRVAQEVAWWGHGRDAVRAFQRGKDWARLQGATHYGYSLAPHYDVFRWKPL